MKITIYTLSPPGATKTVAYDLDVNAEGNRHHLREPGDATGPHPPRGGVRAVDRRDGEATVTAPYSPYECPDCNPVCGCGQCGECAGARTPRCWAHNPLALEELTEGRIRALANLYGEFDPTRDAILQAIDGATPTLRELARARCVELWNERNA